jgi:hypothetical protein
MESQGRFDFAIFGENMAAWVAALLLARQGERVLILPEKREKPEFVGRILFGLEPGGLLLRMLERWGLPKKMLQACPPAHMECLTPETSLWIQGPLDEEMLGSPGYEFRGAAYDKLREVVRSMEAAPEWRADFENEFLRRVGLGTRKNWRWVPFLPDAPASWKRAVRKTVNPRGRGLRLPKEASTGEGTGRLIRGMGHLLYRDEAWIRRAPNPIQVASDLFALRNAYFSDEIFPSIREEFRKILRGSGVEFLPDDVVPHFKRDSSGMWEAFYESNHKQLSLLRFDNLIFARQLEPAALSRFEADAQKLVEADLQKTEFDRYELEVRFQKNPFPFQEPAELVSRSPSGGWVRLSVYQEPRSMVRVGAWIPVDGVQTKGDSKIVAERRLLREIRESLPGLAIDSDHSEISTEIHRERRFRTGIGVKGNVSRVWHAHHQSYPQMAEYGPIVAAIEIARRRARRKGRELSI